VETYKRVADIHHDLSLESLLTPPQSRVSISLVL
jgi:hypothetical protein